MVEKARAAAFLITACEGGQLHLPRLRASMDAFDPAARDRLLAGALLPSAWYLQAQRFRAYWRDLVRPILQRFDVLVAPATPVVATLLGQESLEFGGRSLPVRPNLGIFTQPISFIGLPVVAAPVAAVSGRLPTAVQLIGSPWTESLLLRAARRLEVLGVCSAPVPNPS
jgi:Asp-tRNA(Asn)/Glu-tRNA(Gln) amidotransferase A subunit family amidase